MPLNNLPRAPPSPGNPGNLAAGDSPDLFPAPNASAVYKRLSHLDRIIAEASSLLEREQNSSGGGVGGSGGGAGGAGGDDGNVGVILATFLRLCTLQREQLDRGLGRQKRCKEKLVEDFCFFNLSIVTRLHLHLISNHRSSPANYLHPIISKTLKTQPPSASSP